jgi:arylsulfatase A-like enzyme
MNAGRIVVASIVAVAVGLIALNVVLRRSIGRATVVLVTIDTLRADRLGAYGRSPSITPQLDALAARGVVFENAWTVAPLTVPAHATLLTGLLPPKHGLRVNQPPAPLPAPKDRQFFTLAETLRERGFATAAFVSASVLRSDATGFAAGFDAYDEPPRAAPGARHDAERRGEDVVAGALAWTAERDGPVFLWVHLFDPHAPYDAPVGWGAGPAHVADAQGYDGEVAYADHCVGLLLDGLAKSGRADAVIAVVSDHGEGLGEHGEASHGHLLHEATLRVPLIFAKPGLPPARRAPPVSVLDVFPTLLGLADQPVPPQVNGTPLFDRSAAATAARPIYAESLYSWHACRWAQQFALRRDDEKLVASGPRTMAFDLATDPREDRAKAPDEGQRGALSELMRVAREPTAGSMTAGDQPAQTISYVGSGTPATSPVLSDEENAKLPSPYDRMDVLAKFDRACGLVTLGQGEAALALFDEILRDDAGNLQTAYWRGRAFEALRKFDGAADAYRRAFRMGFRTPGCVAKAIYCSCRAFEAGVAAELDLADAFLVEARGAGVRDDAATYVFESALRIFRGEFDKAGEAIRRAETAPGADAMRERIESAKAELASRRG